MFPRVTWGPVLALTVVSVAATASDTAPWPLGRAPTDTEVAEALAAAEELAERERFEEFLEAAETGEAREHIVVNQRLIDEGRYDLDQLFQFGDSLFDHVFNGVDGRGDSDAYGPMRVHSNERGGLDTYSCAGCHSLGGPNGAGAATQNAMLHGDGSNVETALIRNPPSVLGLGLVQSLGVEMTRVLQWRRDKAIADAATQQADVRVVLETHGVTFGTLVARPDGTVDTSGIEGIDLDLVVKPFGWKGHEARLRRFVETASRIHFRVQSHVLAEQTKEQPDSRLGAGPWWDPDQDGVTRELVEGSLTAAAIYLAMLESPVILPPADPVLRDRWARGEARFDEVGCAECHRPALELLTPIWVEKPDTTEGPGVELNVLSDGELPRGTSLVRLYSDLKRHSMGEGLADPADDPTGVPADTFLTRPLWGLADTAPYLHDGRAGTIPEAIMAHGGEAAESRDAFAALEPEAQQDLHLFLLSLTRTPRLRVPR